MHDKYNWYFKAQQRICFVIFRVLLNRVTHLKSVTQSNRYCLLKVGVRDLYNPNV